MNFEVRVSNDHDWLHRLSQLMFVDGSRVAGHESSRCYRESAINNTSNQHQQHQQQLTIPPLFIVLSKDDVALRLGPLAPLACPVRAIQDRRLTPLFCFRPCPSPPNSSPSLLLTLLPEPSASLHLLFFSSPSYRILTTACIVCCALSSLLHSIPPFCSSFLFL